VCIVNQKMLVGDAHRMMKSRGIDVSVVTDERYFPIGILNM